MGFICCFETGLEPFSLYQAEVIFAIINCAGFWLTTVSQLFSLFFIHYMEHLGITCILNVSAFKAKLFQLIHAFFYTFGFKDNFHLD